MNLDPRIRYIQVPKYILAYHFRHSIVGKGKGKEEEAREIRPKSASLATAAWPCFKAGNASPQQQT